MIKDNLDNVKMALDNTIIDEKLKGEPPIRLIIVTLLIALILIGVIAYFAKRTGYLFKSKKKSIVFYKTFICKCWINVCVCSSKHWNSLNNMIFN